MGELRAAEIAQHEALQKREESRRAHHDALKRKIDDNYEQEIQKERAKKDMEEEQKRVKAKAETLAKQRRKQQKEQLDRWWATEDNDDVESRHAKARERHDEIVNKKKLRDADEVLVTRTVKQQEVVGKVQQLHALIQERPPLPLPRQHDLPRHIVTQPVEKARAVNAKSELGAKLTPRRTPRQDNWKSEATIISNVYGLSDRDKSVVQSHLSQGISGAGRMAEYETKPTAAASAVAA